MQDSQTGAILPLEISDVFKEFVTERISVMPFDDRRKAEARMRAAEKALQDAKDAAQPDRDRQGPVLQVKEIMPTGLILKSLPKLAVALLVCLSLALNGCASTEAYLSNPNTEQAIVSLTSAALAYSQGNTLASAVNAVQGATFFIRSIEPTSTATAAPTPAQLGTAAQQAASLSGVSQPVAAAVGTAVTTMSTQGATPTQALESAAGALMVSTGVPDPGAPVQPAQGPRGHSGRIGVVGRAK